MGRFADLQRVKQGPIDFVYWNGTPIGEIRSRTFHANHFYGDLPLGRRLLVKGTLHEWGLNLEVAPWILAERTPDRLGPPHRRKSPG